MSTSDTFERDVLALRDGPILGTLPDHPFVVKAIASIPKELPSAPFRWNILPLWPSPVVQAVVEAPNAADAQALFKTAFPDATVVSVHASPSSNSDEVPEGWYGLLTASPVSREPDEVPGFWRRVAWAIFPGNSRTPD